MGFCEGEWNAKQSSGFWEVPQDSGLAPESCGTVLASGGEGGSYNRQLTPPFRDDAVPLSPMGYDTYLATLAQN